jgi:Protein of unknown function (DUF2510)
MTDDTPKDKPAPRRTATAKTTAPKAPATKAPATKVTAAKTTPAKTTAARTTGAKAAGASATPAPKAPRAAAKKPVAATVPPVEGAPAAVAPVAAVAAAGWYPVAPGSAQQRWWDGTRWTDHVYDPATAVPAAATTVATAPLRAAEGVKPGTVWFWLIAVGAPVLQILELIPTSFWFNSVLGANFEDPTAVLGAEFNPAYAILLLSGFLLYAYCIVFAALDWRALRARGVPRPFHWAWSFLVLVVSFPIVYVIGRTVVARRRTGSGMAPLWVFVGLEVAAFITNVVFGIYVFIQFVTLFGDGLSAAGNVL